MNCQYPVVKSTLASAARPVQCKREGGILCMVPYSDSMTGVPHLKAQSLCLKHASEVSAWKLIQTLPRKNFSEEEIAWMIASGVDSSMFDPQDDYEISDTELDA